MPNLTGLENLVYDRYYLYNENGTVIRIQHIGDKYQLERKENRTDLTRIEHTLEISEDEFKTLSKLSEDHIMRDSYIIQFAPQVMLRIYHGKYEGLARAEVVFENVVDAKAFEPLDWFGEEITDSPLAQEGKILKLSQKEFKKLLNSPDNEN